MQPDVTELLEFYARPLGGVVRRILSQRIRARWRRVPGSTLVGLGYATPYLNGFRDNAVRVLAFMPAEQGVVNWPEDGVSSAALVDATIRKTLLAMQREERNAPPSSVRRMADSLAARADTTQTRR